MIYAFMSDAALHVKTGFVESESGDDSLVGFFDDNMLNYYMTPAAIRDRRAVRLAVLDDPAVPAIPGMMLHFDRYYSDEELDFNDLTLTQLQQLFNIIELCYLSQGESAEDLDDTMVADSASYGIYIEDSLSISEVLVPSTVTLSDDTVLPDMNIRSYILFDVNFGGTIGQIEFKVWLSKDGFNADYPYCNITTVVFPGHPAKLLSPGPGNIVEVVAEATSWVASVISSEVTNKDHSGVFVSDQAYKNTNYTGDSTINMSFKIFYKGRVPTLGEYRAAIIDAMLAFNADQELWEAIFPYLFVTEQWYILPLWDNVYEIPGLGTEIFSGVSSYNEYKTLVATLFPDESDHELKMELLKVPTSELLLVAYPDVENSITSLKDEDLGHAMYQHSPDDALPVDTQNLKEKLQQALAVIQGAPNIYQLVRNQIGDRYYFTFAVGPVEFHVLDSNEEA